MARRNWRILEGVSVITLFVLLSGCGPAADSSVLSFAPKEENRLVVYTSHKEEVWWPIVREFEECTGIWVDVVTGGTNELLNRIAQEASNPAADVMFGGGVDSLEVYESCFEPFFSSEQEAILERYRSENGLWTPFSSLPVVLIYNTRLLPPGELSSWQDLLRPDLKGKIAFADPGISGSCFTGLATFLQTAGENQDDVLRQFACNLDGKELDSSGDILTAVANGTCWAGVTLEETALKRKDAGDSITLVYPSDGTSLVPDGSAIIRGAAHLDNARRFLDFTVSYDVQQLMAGQYRRPVRGDVKPDPSLPDVSELTLVDYDLTWASKNHDRILMSWAFYVDREEKP